MSSSNILRLTRANDVRLPSHAHCVATVSGSRVFGLEVVTPQVPLELRAVPRTAVVVGPTVQLLHSERRFCKAYREL